MLEAGSLRFLRATFMPRPRNMCAAISFGPLEMRLLEMVAKKSLVKSLLGLLSTLRPVLEPVDISITLASFQKF